MGIPPRLPLFYEIPLLLPLLFTALAGASAQDHIANGSFTGQTAGTAPQKPWIVPSQVTEASDVAVTVETLPGATDGKLWLKLADANPSVPTGVLQNFSGDQKWETLA